MIIVAIFLLLLAIGAPIAIAIGLTTLAGMQMDGIGLTVAAQKMFSGVDSFSLMAIPFFIFAGDLMLEGGTSKRLINMVNKWVGWTVGGLPIAGVISSMFFAALSGSSPATVAAIGGIMIPSMKEAGYREDFTVGLMCASGSLGIIIPPSITFLVYGVISEVSINKLFMAGIIPGILIGLALMLTSYVIARKEGYERGQKPTFKEILVATKDGIWAIMMPIIVLGGIYFGYFTATEAAAVAIVYSIIIGMFVYKEITLKSLFKIAKKSVVVSAMIMFVIATAQIFSWYLTYQKIPNMVAEYILQFATSPFTFLIAINLLLLFVGMFMDASAAVLILVPIFLPVAINLGIDPVHFGVIMIVNLAIGMLSPPFGLNLYVASGISKLSIAEVTKSVIPFIIVLLVTLLIITFIPQLSLILPGMIYGG